MKKISLSLLLISVLSYADSFTNSIGIKFVKIPNGSFVMGTTTKNTHNIIKDETPQHKVHLKSFYIQTTEVTQFQYYKVMGENPSYWNKEELGYDSRNNPVEDVGWYDAKKFVKKLNKKEGTNRYRLCSEKEWEYAARAGSDTRYFFGNNPSQLGRYAWYDGNSGDKTHPVAQKKPNKWGLYDMLGNVYEWTNSCYTKNYNSECYKDYKVLRGGSWAFGANVLRSANRSGISLDDRDSNIGFRLCRTK